MNLLVLKKLLSLAALATASAAAHPAPAPAPEAAAEPAYATPMCDANGRPLAGNVRTKGPQTMVECSPVTASR